MPTDPVCQISSSNSSIMTTWSMDLASKWAMMILNRSLLLSSLKLRIRTQRVGITLQSKPMTISTYQTPLRALQGTLIVSRLVLQSTNRTNSSCQKTSLKPFRTWSQNRRGSLSWISKRIILSWSYKTILQSRARWKTSSIWVQACLIATKTVPEASITTHPFNSR